MPNNAGYWFVSALVVAATLLPIYYVAESSAHLLAFGLLAMDILGVMAARRYYRRLEETLTPAGGALQRSQSVVLSIGMGFGISTVLVVSYLAFLFDF